MLLGATVCPLLYFFFNFIIVIFCYAGSSLLHGLFSSCGEQGLLSSCDVQASLAAEHGLSGTRASVVVAPGL